MTLDSQQQAAVESKAALKVLICGPGSGKSRCVIEAVKAVPEGSRVALMTYTQAGAHVFRQRLSDQMNLVHCGTLHSYAFKLIQRHGALLGYISGKVAILPDKERIPRLLACRDKLGVKISQQAIEERSATHRQAHGIELVWREYEFLLKRNNLVDFELILRDGLALLQMPPVRHLTQLDYLFVDEAQDSAAIDWVIYDTIPATNKLFCGDPDQSIFAFRGAYVLGLTSQAAPEIRSEVHKLELNYRSDTKICAVANLLIRHNKERVDKDCVPVATEMGRVSLANWEDVGQELAWIAGYQRESKSMAVLYRMNHDVKVCRDYLRSMGIPIQEVRDTRYGRPSDWERALLLLGLLNSPDNEILTERFLKLDNQAAIVDRWLVESRAAGKALSSYFATALWFNPDRPTLAQTWQLLAQHGITEGTNRMIQARAELLAPDADLSDLIHALHEQEEPEKAPDGAGVYVGTMHSAKGREWDVVFLPAFEQGIIPSNKVDELEENRRLAFVAVTRARHELYISHCAHRRGPWGPVGMGQPSQFIKEMGL